MVVLVRGAEPGVEMVSFNKSDQVSTSMNELTLLLDAAIQRAAVNVSVHSIDGYYEWQRAGVPESHRAAYVSNGRDALSVVVVINGSDPRAANGAIERRLQSEIAGQAQFRSAPGVGELVISVISLTAIVQDSFAVAARDLSAVDAICLPVAIVLLALFVGSWRLLLLELVTLPCVIVVAFGLCTFFREYVHMSMTVQVANATMQLGMALSFDYALFLLTRFREACSVGLPRTDAGAEQAVVAAMAGSGLTLAVSGLTLMFVAGCMLLAIPDVGLLRGQALATVIAAGVAVCAHLTVFPAILLCFPAFFINAASPPADTSSKPSAKSNTSESTTLLTDQKGLAGSSPPPLSEPAAAFSSFWYDAASATTRWPGNLLAIVAVLLLTAPFAYLCSEFPMAASVDLQVSMDTPLMREYSRLQHGFASNGKLSIYSSTLAIAPVQGTKVLSSEFFNATRQVAKAIASATDGKCVAVTGPSLVCFCNEHGNAATCMDMPVTNFETCLSEPQDRKDGPCVGVRKQAQKQVADGALLFTMLPSFDALGRAGLAWYETALAIAQSTPNEPLVREVYIAGAAANDWDIYISARDNMPLMLVLLLISTFVLLGLTFRSLVIPLRAIFTIVLTVIVAVGFSILVNVHGALAWTHVSSLANLHAIPWYALYWALPLLWGLALDYDIFVLVRVREEWLAGHDTLEAIRRGTALSGSVVTGAGCVMAVAFGGLMLASVRVAQVAGLMMTVAVLFDTFIMRSLVVPALFSVWPESNWWPGSRSQMLPEPGGTLTNGAL